jgi:hypothetical protein
MATRFVDRRALSNLGIYVYGAGAIALGVIGLVWTDFATNWQRVQGNVRHRGALAYMTESGKEISTSRILISTTENYQEH